MKTLTDVIDFLHSLDPAARIASGNGSSVDTANLMAAAFVYQAGVWTDGTHTPTPQESDDNTTWNDVAAADLDGSFTAITSAATDQNTQSVNYLGTKRYLRCRMVVSGATIGAITGGLFAVRYGKQP